MAKRHSHYRARGTGRGSRGRNSGGKPKGAAKKSHKRGNNANHAPVGGGDLSNIDMMDDYYFGHNYRGDSMRMGGFRPGKQQEGETKDEQRNLPLRKRPVEFTKAKDVFDPSHDLILRLREASKKRQQYHSEEKSDGILSPSLELATNIRDVSAADTSKDTEESKSSTQDDENSGHDETTRTISVEQLPDEELYFVDEEPSAHVESLPVHIEREPPQRWKDQQTKATEFEPVLAIGKTLLDLNENNDGSVSVQLPKWKSHPFQPEDSEESNLSDEEVVEIEWESEGESEEGPTVELESDFEDNSDLGFDYTVDNAAELVSDSNSVRSRPSPLLSSDIKSLTIEDSEKQIPGTTQNSLEKQTNADPEFGFLEEDFAVNISEVNVTNIRIGAYDNSYYLRSYRYFGDYEPRWVDQGDLVQFIIELGLPDHRIDAYLQFVMSSIVPKKDEQDALEGRIAKEAALLASESESESDSEHSLASGFSSDEDLGEDLDDLIAYSTKYEAVRNQTFDTKSLETTGRGLKKKLLFTEQMDLDQGIQDVLQDKFTTRKAKKASKKLTKQDYICEQNSTSEDLFLKYPFGFHVQNFKDEFELFLTRNKPSMAFPPLDPHGNRTLMKFAEAYFMKGKKAGKGGKTHVIVEKVKKTKWSFPNYNYINQLMTQRPVFMRIDVRKPREDRIPSERVSGKGKFQVKEGGIVGEDAPEIGTDNIGRRMLEKLGWSSGQGLGAHGNEGISEPIFAKIKKNKSGLRHA
ncbi:LAQU0S05e05578g1_1 [Lachancea quebecensis]|uniref:LAQU0S05e05578g1_1 n=1 Tax=Lachancea quebecensis TaxID=1654605 RepID=A0A0P1KRW3_9SACH|nr:LAQU0S05e05578g1_1 [Lachancea quebecensis]